MDEIQQALKDGDWAAAATLLEARGDHLGAAKLHERILDFPSAAENFLKAGQPLRAVECARRSAQRPVEARILQEVLRASAQPQLQECGRLMMDAGRADLAGPLFDGGGDLEGAAAAYEQAGILTTAARRQLALGNHRAAGQLLEQHLASATNDAHAMLELGAVLARFGRHDAATPLLRKASRRRELAETALRRLALSFHAQGHPHAAQRAIEELRALNPEAPSEMAGLAVLESSAQPARERQGTRIQSRYLLLAPRSASSLGDAYLAYDEFEDRRVLLILFRPEVAHSQAIRKFAGAARAAAALDLPQLLPLVEFNLNMGFMVTAVPHGTSLDVWLRQGILPARNAVIRATGAALLALHRRGITHGVLNLGNIYLSDGGEVQVAEAGAGVLLALRETESQGLQTSLSTLAPEVVGGADAGTPADQFALAALTFQLLTGHWPNASSTTRWRAPSTYLPSLAPFDFALARALSPRAAARFPSVADFLEAMPELPDTQLPLAIPHAAHAAPTIRETPGERLPDVGGVRWHRAQDALLDRGIVVGEGTPGTFEPLRPLALCPAGVERVFSISPDAARCTLGPPLELGNAAALLGVVAALRALHAAGFRLCVEGRMALSPLHLKLSGHPLPPRAAPQDMLEDVGALWLLAERALGPLPSGARDLDALQRALEGAAEQSAVSGRRARIQASLSQLPPGAEAALLLADPVLERAVRGEHI